MTYNYKYTEPVSWGDDNKTLEDYDIHDNELLHAKVQLKLLVQASMLYVFNYIHSHI